MVNKGHRHSEETKRKISESMKGDNNPSKRLDVRKKLSLANKGQTPWMKGKTHTEESKRKMSKERMGFKHSKESRIKMGVARNGKHYPKLSESVKKRFEDKTKHPMWKGGITPLNKILRNKARIKIWRDAVFLRDKFICRNKDCKFCNNEQGVYLQAHHIKLLSVFPKLRFDLKNGITYCKDFHLKSGMHKGILKVKR